MPQSPQLPPANEREPIGRYEWERIVRRIIMPRSLKLFALLLATFADADGTRIRPGNDILGFVSGGSDSTTKRQLAILRREGLIELVSRGGGRYGHGRASEYRLTIPPDLLERFELLGPDCRPLDSGATQMTPHNHPQGCEQPDSEGSPKVTPGCGQSPVDNSVDQADSRSMRGHSGTFERSPGRPTTSHRPTKRSKNPSSHLPAQPPDAHRARDAIPPPRAPEDDRPLDVLAGAIP